MDAKLKQSAEAEENPANPAAEETATALPAAMPDFTNPDPPTAKLEPWGGFHQWVNNKLRARPDTRVYHEGVKCLVEEVTPAGKLRIRVGKEAPYSFALLDFSGDVITALLNQLVP